MKCFSGLRASFFITYLILVLVPIGIISAATVHTYNRATDDIENIMLDYAISQASGNLKAAMSGYRNTLSKVVTDTGVLALVREYTGCPPRSAEAAYARNLLQQRFSTYVQADSAISALVLAPHSGDVVAYDSKGLRFAASSKWANGEFLQAFLARCEAAGDGGREIGILSGAGLPGAPRDIDQYIYFVFPAIDLIGGRTYGMLVMEVENRVFNAILNIQIDNDMLDSYIGVASCLTDRSNAIVTSPNRASIGMGLSELSAGKDGVLLSRSLPVERTGLTLNLVYDSGSLQQYIRGFSNLVTSLVIVVTGIFVLLVFVLTGRLYKKVDRMAGAIREFGHDLRRNDLPVDKGDRIFYPIASQFRLMAAQINGLVEELKEKNQRIVTIMNQRREAELRALQAQVNPHFLYNALDRINWIAIDNGQHEISGMLSGLGSLLRYSVSNIDTLVPLEAEIEWMKKYIFIQNKRFDIEIDFLCNTHGEAMGFPLYKMLLQPIVENSILHGFPPDKKGGCIELAARVCPDGRLEINLADNGVGMDTETLEWLRGLLSRRDGSDGGGIGLRNVASRLWLYYGTEAEIHVENRVGGGTAFSLRLPART